MVLSESAAIIRLGQSLSVAPCPPNDFHDQPQAGSEHPQSSGAESDAWRLRCFAAVCLCG